MIVIKTCLLPAKTHKNRAKNKKFFCPLLDISVSGSPVVVPKISCSLFAHEILTTATRSPPSSCLRQQSARSPIIQDGKLVGAVTHVLVNDPTTGYGIFIENMLDAAA